MKRYLLPPEYASLAFTNGAIRLTDVFPDGIAVEIHGDNIELLTPPDSRYKVIDGVVVRVDAAGPSDRA